jgi:hypothetical protein
VAWNVSEGEPTCPASSFFKFEIHWQLRLLALFDLHSALMHLAGPLNGIRSVLPAESRKNSTGDNLKLRSVSFNQSRASAELCLELPCVV